MWKLDCPSKIKHFLWQSLSGCIATKHNLNNRGIKCDPHCDRCGGDTETINHVLFECPPAIQTWALSGVPSAPDCFPRDSIWYNMDFLLWRIPDSIDVSFFPWIVWHLWKDRNDKCFSGGSKSPQEILETAKQDYREWGYARKALPKPSPHGPGLSGRWSSLARPSSSNAAFLGFKCFVDGSWKETSVSSGLVWICFPDHHEGTSSGARQIRRSLSPLHSEVEAILWAMESLLHLHRCEVDISTDCSNAWKVLFQPQDWPAFKTYQEDFARLSSLFRSFSLSIIPKALNHRADFLARSIRESAHGMVIG